VAGYDFLMEITPQLLKEIEFKEAWRGYDREQVDALLERIGSALAQLQGRLREALDRADAAETRTVVAGGRSETEDTLRRTLVLAQRTADAAIAEAEEDAARIRGDAQADADRIVREANAAATTARLDADAYASETTRTVDAYALETRRDADAYALSLRNESEAMRVSLRAEAEAEARRVAEATRAPLVEEIRELERSRSFMQEDVALLDTHLAEQRSKIREELTAMTRLLDLPEAFRTEPPPALSGIEVPSGVWQPTQAIPRVGLGSPFDSPFEAPIETAAPHSVRSLDDPESASPSTPDELVIPAPPHDPPTAIEPSLAKAPSDATLTGDAPPWVAEPAAVVPADEDDIMSIQSEAIDLDEPWTAVAPEPTASSEDRGSEAEVEQPAPRAPSRSDEFLAQLRRAVDDDVEDGPGMSAFFDDEDEEQPRSRFGRRR
jgi:DivIVA domain-containing protein